MSEAPATVLVADDSEAKRYLLVSWLRSAGHRVVEAATGREALDRVAGVDLVVLDVRLPDLSGTEVCGRIKSDPATAAIPVIQVSAIAVAVADRALGLNEGADAYLAEPFQAEEFLATVTATLRYFRARRQAERAAARLTALTQVTLAMNAAETFDRLARTAAQGAAEIFGAPAGLLLVLPEGQLRRFSVSAPGELTQQGGPVTLSDTLAARVLTGGAHYAIAMIGRAEWRQLVPDTVLPGDACVAVCRAKAGRAPVVIAVDPRSLAGEDEQQILRQLVQSVALAVEALRAYADEHLVALTLQRSLLPSALPELPGLQMCARYVPASDQAEIGGDFYEVLEQGDLVVAAIGDVQGHSLHAATVMGELRHALRAFAGEGHRPRAIASLVNKVLQRYHPGIIATMCLVQLNVATGEMEIVNCGHIPPLLMGEGPAAYRGQGGMLLGAPVDHAHVERAVLPPGGTLLMITDGLVEDRGSALDDNLELLRQAAQARPGESLDAVTDRILALFGAREDDVALIALRRGPAPAGRGAGRWTIGAGGAKIDSEVARSAAAGSGSAMSDRHGSGQLLVVPLPAEIDISNSESVGAELGAACASGAGVIIADLTSTAFCDSSGIRYLLLAHDEAAAHHAQLRLAVQPDGMVLRMLTLMGLHRVLQVHVSLDEATAA